jgi:hypothetical protein
MNKIKSHIFRGKRYKIIIGKIDKGILKLNPRCRGLCDAPNTKDKTINLDSKLSGIDLMKVAIDEGIHACCWDLNNTTVDEMSDSISKFLYRLGAKDITGLT